MCVTTFCKKKEHLPELFDLRTCNMLEDATFHACETEREKHCKRKLNVSS